MHVQVIFRRFLTWVRHISNLGMRDLGDKLSQITHAVGLCHLVDDLDAITLGRRVVQSELNATHHVPDVDKGTCLATRAMHGQWIANARLDEEAV